MKKHCFFTLLTGALLLLASQAFAQSSGVTIPISGIIQNPCNGENVTYSGTVHLVGSTTLDNAGGYHEVLHDNIRVTGVGDLGNSYVGTETDNFNLNGKVGGENTQTEAFTMTSLGSAPNFDATTILHITVTPAGTITAYVSNFSATCHG